MTNQLYSDALPQLSWHGDRLCVVENGVAVPVQCRYCRPQSDPGGPIVIRRDGTESGGASRKHPQSQEAKGSLDASTQEESPQEESTQELKIPQSGTAPLRHIKKSPSFGH